MQEFYQFLERHRVEKGADFTHTSLGYPRGSYYVSRDHHASFLDAYTQAVSQTFLYMTEKHCDISPVLIDLDFKYNGSDKSRRYNETHLKHIVTGYIACMSELLNLRSPVTAVIMEKPNPTECAVGIKDGIHIVFPDIVTPPTEQYMIRTEVLKRLPQVIADLAPANPWNCVIDDNVIVRNNWMMYGSVKPGAHAYSVTRVWKVNFGMKLDGLNDLDFTEDTTHNYNDVAYWVTRLSIRNKMHVTETLPHRRKDVFALEEQIAARKKEVQPDSTTQTRVTRCVDCYDDYEIARRLTGILSPERATNYDSWIRVGWCLYNIDPRLLPEWETFSRKSTKYVEGECQTMWRSKMRKDSLGMGSLMKWAREDNPDECSNVVKDRVRTLILKSCASEAVTHHDVAKVIHAMYRHRFACANIRNKHWYEFKNHRWRTCDSAYTLRMHISTEVYSEYLHTASYFQQKAHLVASSCAVAENGREDESQTCIDKVKRINAAALKLKTVSFKKGLMEELSDMFYYPNFEEKLNSAPHLLGFENGVYDLDKSVFRDGEPDDFISFSTGYDYTPYDAMHSTVLEINDFFNKVFRIPSVRNYVINTLASALHGGMKYERYTIWHGEQGANGKSKLLDLTECVFGDYSVKFPVSLLTQKRVASNAATSELARSKGRRFASMQEPGENEVLNIGLMKELSGNDKIIARHLFHEPIEFRPFYKLFMCCNQLPAVHSQDGGTWRRIRVVQFNSRFCENPDPDNPSEFKVDYDLSNKFENWKPHLMAMLLHMMPDVRKGIREPPEVLDYTLRYRKENDSVSEFYENCIKEVPDEVPRPVVTSTSLWNDFLIWRRRENITRLVKRTDFKIIIEKLLGSKNNSDHTGWQGYAVTLGDDSQHA